MTHGNRPNHHLYSTNKLPIFLIDAQGSNLRAIVHGLYALSIHLGWAQKHCFYFFLSINLSPVSVVEGEIKYSIPLCREGLFLLLYNELAVAQGPKIYQKKAL